MEKTISPKVAYQWSFTYVFEIPKWQNMEEDDLAKGSIPVVFD
jgi:hypothetical protein